MLDSVFVGPMTPGDCRQLAKAVLSQPLYVLWKNSWQTGCAALVAAAGHAGPPLHGTTLYRLVGRGQFTASAAQIAQLRGQEFQASTDQARRAFNEAAKLDKRAGN